MISEIILLFDCGGEEKKGLIQLGNPKLAETHCESGLARRFEMDCWRKIPISLTDRGFERYRLRRETIAEKQEQGSLRLKPGALFHAIAGDPLSALAFTSDSH